MDVRNGSHEKEEKTVDELAEGISIETPEADAVEQSLTTRGDDPDWVYDISPEADPADAAEQSRAMREDGSGWPDSIPLEADPADAFEQSLTVDGDEDDYR
jgi:hypothetical protein